MCLQAPAQFLLHVSLVLLEYHRLGPMLCLLRVILPWGLFRVPSLTSYGSVKGQQFWVSAIQGDPIGNGTFPQAPFSAHLLNHLLCAYCLSGIVLGQVFNFFNFHFQGILDLQRSCKIVERITVNTSFTWFLEMLIWPPEFIKIRELASVQLHLPRRLHSHFTTCPTNVLLVVQNLVQDHVRFIQHVFLLSLILKEFLSLFYLS